MNSNEIKSGTSCNHSYDDENCSSSYSEVSQPSPSLQTDLPLTPTVPATPTTPTTPISSSSIKVREEPPIRVRDMINLYNFATQKNQELAHAKSIYFGGSLKSAQMELSEMDALAHQHQQHQQQQQQLLQQRELECCDGVCHKMPAQDVHLANSSNSNSSSSRLHSKKPGNFRVTTAEDQTSLRQSLQADAVDGESVEKSYQSKTTIRRTEHGVRIIIDIFFDKNESDIDIVGSRVETDIPESRILADFQQHSLAMRGQQIKSQQSPNV